MSCSLLRRFTTLTLAALMIAAHLPLPTGVAASKMACCAPKACCQTERACTSGGACADHSKQARAPIVPGLPSLLAGNCGDPTPRAVPVSYDPVTQPSDTAIRADAPLAAFPVPVARTAPARDLLPSVPPPRA